MPFRIRHHGERHSECEDEKKQDQELDAACGIQYI